jgi:hypothetical protein
MPLLIYIYILFLYSLLFFFSFFFLSLFMQLALHCLCYLPLLCIPPSFADKYEIALKQQTNKNEEGVWGVCTGGREGGREGEYVYGWERCVYWGEDVSISFAYPHTPQRSVLCGRVT